MPFTRSCVLMVFALVAVSATARAATPSMIRVEAGATLHVCEDQVRVGTLEDAVEFARAAPSAQMVVSEGTYEIADQRILQVAGDVMIEPGVTVLFGARASVVFLGRVNAVGTAEKPILFTRAEGVDAWGVMLLSPGASDGSYFGFCTFEHSSQREIAGVNYIATLYGDGVQNVEVADCTFQDILNDGDGINFKNAYSLVTRSTFRNCGDAVDYDASQNGIVEYCEFIDNRDDGVDLGEEAQAIVRYNRIFGSGDKGVSVGERSDSIVHNNLIGGCNLGIAIKDQSDPWVVNNTFVGNGTGITAYRKTPFLYGGGRGRVVNCIVWDSVVANIDLDSESTTQFFHCNIQGGFEGLGNIDQDPLFTILDGLENFLGEGSPSIDTGHPRLNDAIFDTSELWPGDYSNGAESDMGVYGGPENTGWF